MKIILCRNLVGLFVVILCLSSLPILNVKTQTFMTITIANDGSIDPKTAPIQYSGNIYTLTDDINGNIIILEDDIILDGNGFTLQGDGTATGIFLKTRTNVVIKDFKITNFKQGIQLEPIYIVHVSNPGEGCNNITISGNTITNNDIGIKCYHASNTFLYGNNLQNNNIGLSLWNCVSSVLRENQMWYNERNLVMSSYSVTSTATDDIDASNLVNGRRIYYLINKHNMTVPYDAGMVVLVKCSEITVENLVLTNNRIGLALVETTDSLVKNNIIANNGEGIRLVDSSNNTITENILANNSQFNLISDSENIFFDNEFPSEVPELPTPPPLLPTPSPTPTTTPTPSPSPEPFPTTLAVVSIAIIAVIATGILVYFKKYKK